MPARYWPQNARRLNLIQRLSGIATVTAAYVARIEGTGASVIDTRKTTPGMRYLEKAAVRHGGGSNHRFNLGDAVLIKDNHLAAIGGKHPIRDAVTAAKQRAPHTSRVEVEVVDLDGVQEALDARADIIMLDNMSLDEMRQAVKLVDGRALLEASGGITLDTVRGGGGNRRRSDLLRRAHALSAVAGHQSRLSDRPVLNFR